MNSKEALENIVIDFDNMGMICSNLGYEEFYCKDLHFKEIFKSEYESILRDLERLEKLEKEYKESRKVIKSWNENGGELLRENAKLKKVIEIVNGKTIVIVALKLSKDLNDYIRMTSFENLTQEEYDLLKEYLDEKED